MKKQKLWYKVGNRIANLWELNSSFEDPHVFGVYLFSITRNGVKRCQTRILIPNTLYGVWWLVDNKYNDIIKNKEEFLHSNEINGFSLFGDMDKVYSLSEFPYLL